jgi:Tol biopolymer transport system component
LAHQKHSTAFLITIISRAMALCVGIVLITLFVGRMLPNPRILAYETSGNIYLADLDRGFHHPLTHATEDLSYWTPAFSPDGEHIAVVAGDRLEFQYGRIYIMDRNGHNLRRVTQRAYYGSLSWSPDGKQIVASERRTKRDQLVTIDVETGTVIPITLATFDWAALWPSWSPDGTQIAFASDYGVEFGLELYVFDVTSQHLRQLTDGSSGIGQPSWSPDGETILVPMQIGNEYGITDFYTVNVRSGEQTQLTIHFEDADSFSKDSPKWSPDGQQIVFTMQYIANIAVEALPLLYVMDADGDNLRRVTNNEGRNREHSPSWYP